jgi:hypothetical protein
MGRSTHARGDPSVQREGQRLHSLQTGYFSHGSQTFETTRGLCAEKQAQELLGNNQDIRRIAYSQINESTFSEHRMNEYAYC